jgi:3-carboxy-cis,cis-muconate cycloisomerase
MIGPFDHPWLGALFGDTQAAEIWGADRQLAHILAFEAAYTRALGQVGKVEASVADTVAQQIKAFKPDMANLRAGTARDGVLVPALVAQLKQAIPHDSGCIHTGTTSQDVIDTALALTLRDFNGLLDDRMSDLIARFDDLGARFGDKTLMGRTRMQVAMPITFSDRLTTWTQPLAAHRNRLSSMRSSVACLQLGGAAGNRAALAPHGDDIARYMATELGLHNPPHVWHAMRGGVVEYAGLLSLISGSLGKFGQDICLMAQQGIDEVTLTGGGGSSAMPHKQNPVLAELLVTLARFNATQVSAMHQALVHEQERSGTAWALEWMILPQMAQATARSLSIASDICGNIKSLGAE